MYGWRAKIGLISPMPGENVEHAFHIYAPDGVSFSSMKMPFPGPTPEGLAILTGQLKETAAKYKGQPMDLLAFCCTSGSFIRGPGWDKACIADMEEVSGIPAITTSTAVLEALTALKAHSVAVLTPYPEETNRAEREFLEQSGFTVTNIEGMDVRAVKGHLYDADMPFLYRNSMKMDRMGADVFFLSCVALDTLGFVGRLEHDLGVPVVTSHQATLWNALRRCGVRDAMPQFGQLFTLDRPTDANADACA